MTLKNSCTSKRKLIMLEKIIFKDNLDVLLDKNSREYEVYAPARAGIETVWSPVTKADDLDWNFTNTDLSPKSFLFPQTECMLEFKNVPRSADGMILKRPELKESSKALFNIRPCDAKAFSVLDLVFEQDPQKPDVYWKDKREKTLLIGLACNHPCPACFCTSVECGPHHTQGLDILMQDLEDRLVLKPLTPKGENLLSDLDQASEQDINLAAKLEKQAEEMFQGKLGLENIQAGSILDIYEHSAWERLYESCINCGACTFYCPTCHCFDIQDETRGTYGRRVRNWDTCMSSLFTLHTSGHNPRGRRIDRFRQRFMHKFKYMPFKLKGALGCVGCGRCTQKCPVNIDVREVVNTINI
jgi:sulfhydrogenase subunit beta (sulfur reductase)